MVTLVHTPELCLAREEYAPEFGSWLDEMDDRAARLNVRVRGSYSCPAEHTFWFVLEADDAGAVTAFFSGVMLANNTGRIAPVISLKEAAAILSR